GLVSRATVTEENDVIYVKISGEDSGTVIGYRGETLDALQYLAMIFLNENKAEQKKAVVDCENYREKRKEALTALALRLAEKAVRLRRKIELEPMNPFERRVIHSALADGTIATTQSEGEDMSRHIVIIPVGVELKDERPLKNGERENNHDRNHKDGRHGNHGGRNNNRRDGGRGRDDRRRSGGERKPRTDEPEVEDGNVYLGYFTEQDDFVKPTAQAGPPKFKSFGGKKRF
ncbi:MAG: KH domain-containing protein, partial [Clostridia bacterium]|nr:KH domain-containing protein [Clostridia bacterium]